MKLLGSAVALFGLVEIGVGVASGLSSMYLLAAFTLVAAATTFRSVGISTFLQVLIAYFSIETIVLGLCVCSQALGQWPAWLTELPSTVVMTVAMFSTISYLTSFIPVARKALAIADRYFRATDPAVIPLGFGHVRMRERTFATATIMFIIFLNQIEVWLTVRLSYVSFDFSNALQAYDSKAFWHALLVKYPLNLTPLLLALFIEFMTANTLFIRWRRWLTDDYSRRWLDHHNHYGMMLAGIGTDNPDQRIQEDIPRFINGTDFGTSGQGVYSFSITLISSLSELVSFSIILWNLSSVLTIPGTSFHVPGLLLWCAIVYATLGTGAAALIGRPLARLAFAQQHFEANFRFGLARLREYSEQIALLFGEATEKSILVKHFSSIMRNFYSMMLVRAFLSNFNQFFSHISGLIPYILVAPFYFAKTATLGVLTQSSRAFGAVNGTLTLFVNYYASLAEFKSVLDRLTTFDASLAAVPPPVPLVRAPAETNGDFVLSNVHLHLPGGKALSGAIDLRLAANENVLLTGPSGTGKSTLFRAISGVWPYVDGTVEVPAGASIMVLPQKPYLPAGTLSGAICYPREAGSYPEAEIVAALDAVELGQLKGLLDIDDHWTQRLSGGEQQRLAIARAMLAKPTWLLLDEATAAMDAALEGRIYRKLAEQLPATTVVSIAHRDSLADHHKRHLVLTPAPDGTATLADERVAAE